MNESSTRTKTTVRSKTAATVKNGDNIKASSKLTEKEVLVRKMKKYATTSSTGFNSRAAMSGYNTGGLSESSSGNFYSPQLSTDFLEKPQNLRERRAWYRNFYNANEFVGQAIDLHSTLPLSKIRLEKPHGKNMEQIEYVYDFFLEMCNEIKLFKTLLEISHEYHLLGNCLEKGAEVKTLSGIKRADEVCVGDMLLTDRGRYRKVLKACIRPSSNIYNIKCWKSYKKLPVTGEHPIEVYREGKFVFIKAEELTVKDYIRVTWPVEEVDVQSMSMNFPSTYEKVDGGYISNVTVNHPRVANAIIAKRKMIEWLGGLSEPVVISRQALANEFGVPIRSFNAAISSLQDIIEENFHERIGANGFQKGSQVKWLPVDTTGIEITDTYINKRQKFLNAKDSITISNDFAYLAGYWLGDGTLSRDSSRDNWGRGLWQISAKDTCSVNINRVHDILVNIFGSGAIKVWTSGGITNLKVNSNPAFIEWWSDNFGGTSLGKDLKRIPDWFTKLPTEKLKHFLAGVVDSDGCITIAGPKSHTIVTCTMVSKDLIDSIRDIIFKCGAICSLNHYSDRECTLPNGEIALIKNVYTITSSDELSCEILSQYSNKNIPEDAHFPEEGRYWVDVNGSIAFKVKSIKEQEYNDLVYNFEVEEDHTYQVAGYSTHNCFIYSEDHNPYEVEEGDKEGEAQVGEMKEWGKTEAERLFKEFKVVDKDPNYKGWRKLIILPPDQVRIKKIPFSDESLIEFIPDPETRKSILSTQDPSYYPLSPEEERSLPRLPRSLSMDLQKNGSIPLDTDPFSGSYVYHMARKKSQYETLGVSILERCINTLLLQDKLRQAQTQIASRHMTPIRVVWAEDLSDVDVENLREQVDLALVDPDFSIIANYEVHWEEMGSNGRLLELSTEYEHIENSLFAGLGVTREILTGEGTYAGNKMTLEILNTQYLLFRELLQEYVEEYLFKPVAKKKGFIEKDKYGREKLIYPKLSFTRLAIKDNDTFFDQAMQLYNKGSISIDVILEMLNIDPISTKKKIEADLFTVNDFAFNQLMANVYNVAGQALVEKYTVAERLANYMNLDQLPPPPPGEEGAGGLGGSMGGGLGGMGRFSSSGMDDKRQAALAKLLSLVMKHPEKLDKIADYLSSGK
jgi:hypothetical protein